MPWLSNMLLNGMFVAQATPAAPGVATPADAGTPVVVVTPVDAGTPAAVVTPAAPGTPGGDTGTPAVVITPADMTPADNGTPSAVVATPGSQGMPPIQYEPYQNGLSGMQWFILILFSLMCIGLITCVLFQNSKSDGLGGMMGGGGMNPSSFKGKKSSEERLSQVTTWFAGAFIITSLGMAILFK